MIMGYWTPNFFRRLNHYLLLNHPEYWYMRLHHVLMLGLAGWILSFVLASTIRVHPWGFPATNFYFASASIICGLATLWWLYVQARAARFLPCNWYWSGWSRFPLYLLCVFVINAPPYIIAIRIDNRFQSLFPKDDQTFIEELRLLDALLENDRTDPYNEFYELQPLHDRLFTDREERWALRDREGADELSPAARMVISKYTGHSVFRIHELPSTPNALDSWMPGDAFLAVATRRRLIDAWAGFPWYTEYSAKLVWLYASVAIALNLYNTLGGQSLIIAVVSAAVTLVGAEFVGAFFGDRDAFVVLDTVILLSFLAFLRALVTARTDWKTRSFALLFLLWTPWLLGNVQETAECLFDSPWELVRSLYNWRFGIDRPNSLFWGYFSLVLLLPIAIHGALTRIRSSPK
jgi:hypothetical protein